MKQNIYIFGFPKKPQRDNTAPKVDYQTFIAAQRRGRKHALHISTLDINTVPADVRPIWADLQANSKD